LRRKKSPYPARGTEAGEQIVGPCEGEGCERILRRGDSFTVLLGDRLLCTECNLSGNSVKKEKTVGT